MNNKNRELKLICQPMQPKDAGTNPDDGKNNLFGLFSLLFKIDQRTNVTKRYLDEQDQRGQEVSVKTADQAGISRLKEVGKI